MPFGWGESEDAHQQVYGDGGPDNQAKFSHELIAGAASFEGFKLFEDHQRKQGHPVEHAFAKEVLAGFVGGEVDKLAETKGRDAWDDEQNKRHQNTKKYAQQGAQDLYDQHYQQDQGADQYYPDSNPPSRLQGRGDNY